MAHKYDGLLQDVIEIPFGGVAASPLRPERRPLLHFSQGREQRAVQSLRAGCFRLGFDKELVALFPARAFRRDLVESLPDRLGVRAADPSLSLSFMGSPPLSPQNTLSIFREIRLAHCADHGVGSGLPAGPPSDRQPSSGDAPRGFRQRLPARCSFCCRKPFCGSSHRLV
jgi:hypothetical protein